jgi:1-acyl-sn-glycerol-3-phosphate acyltransferase
MAYRFSRFVLLLLLKLFFRFESGGQESIPKEGGFILVCNHVSYLDPVALGAACYRSLSFMAKEDLFKRRFLRGWLKAVNVIPVKRNAADLSALKTGIRVVHSGGGLGLFPEGTRRTPQTAYSNPEPGVGFLADKGNVPVIPAFVSGTEVALPRGAKHLKFCKIKVRFGEQILIERGKPYHEISEMIMAKVKSLAE